MLFTQTCCRNAVRDARLTVHLTQLQVFLVLQFGPPSVSDVLLVSLNSLNPISSARSFKMPAANRECPSSAQCKLPARGRRATTPTLAIQASHLPFNSSDTYHAPLTSRRHDSYHLQTIIKHHAHIGPLLVVVLVLFLFLSNSFNFALRLGFSSWLASRNRWRIATVTFSAMFYFQAESNAFNGRCRPSLRKTSDQGTDRHHLSFTLFTFGFGPLPRSFLPFISFIPRPPQARQAGRSPRSFVLFLNSFPPN